MLVMDLTQEIWTGVFQQFNIKSKYDTRPWQGVDSLQTTTFIIGIGSQVEHNQVYSELKRNLLDGTIPSHQSMVTTTSQSENPLLTIDLKRFVFSLIDRIGIQRFWSQFNDLANVIGEKLQMDASVFKNMVAYKFAHAEALRHTCIDFRSDPVPPPSRFIQLEDSQLDEADMFASGYQGETFGHPIHPVSLTHPEESTSQFNLSQPFTQLSPLSSSPSQSQTSTTSSQPRRHKHQRLPSQSRRMSNKKKRTRIKQEIQRKPDMTIVIDCSDSD
jgi:hypothetical protein